MCKQKIITMKNLDKIKTFKNWRNENISFEPFYHTAKRLYRVSRCVNGVMHEVYENKGYDTLLEALYACNKKYNYWANFNKKAVKSWSIN